jgi:hypothetical protein
MSAKRKIRKTRVSPEGIQTETVKTKTTKLRAEIERLEKELAEAGAADFFDYGADVPKLTPKTAETLVASLFHEGKNGEPLVETPPPPEKVSRPVQALENLMEADEEKMHCAVANADAKAEAISTEAEVSEFKRFPHLAVDVAPPHVSGLDKSASLGYFRSLEGRVLTILDASSSDRTQREALKTLIRKEFRSTMTSIEVALTPPR